MPFDITQLFTREASNTGIKIELLDPKSGQAFKDANGNSVMLMLRGQDSDVYCEVLAQLKREAYVVWTAEAKGETEEERTKTGFEAYNKFLNSKEAKDRLFAAHIIGIEGDKPLMEGQALQLVQNSPLTARQIEMEASFRGSFFANVSANSTSSPAPNSV